MQRLPLLAVLYFCCAINPSSGATHPDCTSASSDSDGDGWGWENNTSCRVVIDVNPTAPTVPACTNAASDPDGDGWGWENNQSCRVDQTSPTIPTNNPAPDSTTPDCTSAQSDPDNDGWGWENNRSCRVTTATPTPVTPTPAPVAPERIVMAVGDSITHGFRGNASYRKPLVQLLNNAGCKHKLVGSQTTTFGSNVFTAPHESYSGQKADHFLTGQTTSSGVNRGIAHSMAAYNPDVVLLHIGSNDMKTDTVDSTLSEIDQIISLIQQHNNAVEILVANLVPWLRDDARTKVQQLGTRIEAYVAQLGSPLVRLVDVRSGFADNMLNSDQIHPNASGEAHIADAFFDVYDSAGLCQ